jgi:hypothetical protein
MSKHVAAPRLMAEDILDAAVAERLAGGGTARLHARRPLLAQSGSPPPTPTRTFGDSFDCGSACVPGVCTWPPSIPLLNTRVDRECFTNTAENGGKSKLA